MEEPTPAVTDSSAGVGHWAEFAAMEIGIHNLYLASRLGYRVVNGNAFVRTRMCMWHKLLEVGIVKGPQNAVSHLSISLCLHARSAMPTR